MTSIKRVAVIGATGMLGLPVTAALVDAGFAVTALARDPERARGVLPPGVSVVRADVRDEESLRRGLRGQDALYLSLAVAPHERPEDYHTEAQGLQCILAAAKQAQLKRVAYLSALVHDTESDWWVLDIWRQALARIKSSGIPYTIFYPTNFMETLAERHVVGRCLVTFGRPANRNFWIAGRDYGQQVARSLMLPRAANREYVVQGPQPFTYDEAAKIYAQAQPRPPTLIRVPMPLARAAGLFSREMAYNASIMSAVLNYPERFKAQETWDDLGRPETTLDDFAREAAARSSTRLLAA
jgi:uncharacterized protein YbjT (DUF2867 family)